MFFGRRMDLTQTCAWRKMKNYTKSEVVKDTLNVLRKDLIEELLPWQLTNYTETQSGDWSFRLASRHKIMFEGKARRIYITIYSNNGTAWFKYKGKKIVVNDL